MASAKYRLSASLHWHRSTGESRKKAGPGRQRRNFCGQKRIAGFWWSIQGACLLQTMRTKPWRWKETRKIP